MNCAELQEVVNDLVRGTVPASMGLVARAHADSCGKCDKVLACAEHLNSALLALASADRDAQMPLRAKADLMSAFRRQRAPKPLITGVRTRWFTAIGVAAALLIALVLYQFGTGKTLSHLWTHSPKAPVIENASTNNAGNVLADAAPQTDAENVTSFVDLPYAEPWVPDDGEAVLRVAVPQSTLASYGLPVVEASRDENVTADFIVGEDGLPRAVRLVQ